MSKMHVCFLWSLLFVIKMLPLQAQNVSPEEIGIAHDWAWKCEFLSMMGNFKMAIQAGYQAKTVLAKAGWEDGVAKVQSTMSRCFIGLKQLDSAAHYINSNLEKLEKYPISGIERAGSNFMAGMLHEELFKHDTAKIYFERALEALDNFTFSDYSGLSDEQIQVVRLKDSMMLEQLGGIEKLKLSTRAYIYNYWGIAHMESSYYREAEGLFRLAIADFRSLENELEIINCQINLAMAYLGSALGSGLSYRPVQNFEETVKNIEQSGMITGPQLAAIQRVSAYFFQLRRRPEKSLEAFKKAYKTLENADAQKVEQLFLLPKDLMMLNLEAEKLALVSQIQPESTSLKSELTELNEKLENFPQQEDRPWNALILALSKIKLARVYGSLNLWNEAQRTYESVFHWVFPGNSLYDPQLKTKSLQIPDQREGVILFELFANAAYSLEEQFLATKDTALLLQAFDINTKGIELGEAYRTYFSEQLDQIQLLATSLTSFNLTIEGLYISAIRIMRLLNPQDHQAIFKLIEANKAFVLRSNINRSHITQSLPDSIRRKELEMREEAIKIRADLRIARTNKQNAQILELERKWAERPRIYREFAEVVKKELPKYHDLFYKNSVPNLKQVQNDFLDANSAILEFKMGRNFKRLYIMCITKENTEVKTVELSEDFFEILQRFYQWTSQPKNAYKEAVLQEYVSDAYFLYQALIKPFENQLQGIDHLVIVPSVSFHSLNFELLIKEAFLDDEAEWSRFVKSPDFSSLPLLLFEYSIQYGHSVETLLSQSKFTYEPPSNAGFKWYGGFEPLYDEDHLQRIATKYSGIQQDRLTSTKGAGLRLQFSEVERTRKLFPEESSVVFRGLKATESNLRKALDRYKFNILHISAHGFMAPSDPLNSTIALAKPEDDQYDGQLNVGELYHLSAAANLTIISSCNSGNSNFFADEEGLISLGRGFFYAGCPSTIIGLWQMPPAPTEDVISNTCKLIKNEGKTFAKALQLAKIEYLKNEGISASNPYLWGALTLWGNNRALSF